MWRPRLGAWLALLGVLVVAGVLFGRGLDAATNYDEGVYLASLDALTHDQALGKDVYASQPPGFYVLLQAPGWQPPTRSVGAWPMSEGASSQPRFSP
jgi:hypothetical protein